jgi:hypothetical protein
MPNDNTNSGIIGKNLRKEQDTHPDITGHINVEGKEFWLNGWQKTNSKDGSVFYSLSVKPKEARQEQPTRTASAPSFENKDEIPFLYEWRG